VNAPVAWHARRGVGLAAAHVACLAAIVVAWRATAGRATVGDQVLWLNLAVIGAVASGIVNGAWLLRLQRDVAGRRHALLGHLDADNVDVGASPAQVEESEALVTVVGMSLVHRERCALVAGKPVEAATTGAPCGWCRP
jgi:hypothetical protein